MRQPKLQIIGRASLLAALFGVACEGGESSRINDDGHLETEHIATRQDALFNSGWGGGMNYTCTTEIGQPKTCTCKGYVDCQLLKTSGECQVDGVTIMLCTLDGANCCCKKSADYKCDPTPKSGPSSSGLSTRGIGTSPGVRALR